MGLRIGLRAFKSNRLTSKSKYFLRMGKTAVSLIIKDNINEVLKCTNKLIRWHWNKTGLRIGL
jgi:hypothetical protein